MQSGKAEVYEVGGHIVTSKTNANFHTRSHTRSVHMKRYSPD